MLKVFKTKKPIRLMVLTTLISATSMITFAGEFDYPAGEEPKEEVSTVATSAPNKYGPALQFRTTLTGEVMDIVPIEGKPQTDEAKKFIATGENPYVNDKQAIEKGYTIFSTACSGCHGHLAEGKLGPALADDYWTYPKNEEDKGLFETVYGGANGMMGPQKGRLSVDEILHVIAWIRHQKALNDSGASAEH